MSVYPLDYQPGEDWEKIAELVSKLDPHNKTINIKELGKGSLKLSN